VPACRTMRFGACYGKEGGVEREGAYKATRSVVSANAVEARARRTARWRTGVAFRNRPQGMELTMVVEQHAARIKNTGTSGYRPILQPKIS
jgi:hypothetical protein